MKDVEDIFLKALVKATMNNNNLTEVVRELKETVRHSNF